MSRRIALIVGVAKYKPSIALPDLPTSLNDAQAIYEVLNQYGGFDALYPLPLDDEKLNPSGIVLSQELESKLYEVLISKSDEEDKVELVVIYFSGHGVSDRGQTIYLSSSDKRFSISLSWLANLAKKSKAKNICLWLDCCHSGEILKFTDLSDKGFSVIAASSAVGEALAHKGKHGLLTNLLCDALTPTIENNRQEIRVLDFVQEIEKKRKNLPQQVLCRWGDAPFTLTHITANTTVNSPYPPDHLPFKGLLAFRQNDHEFFFGRDQMIQQLLDKLKNTRFIPLLGHSGSGKSSLIFSGLLPKLSESDWHIVTMQPGSNPLINLRSKLIPNFSKEKTKILNNEIDLHNESLQITNGNKRLLLIIDQFEEVFSECRDKAIRSAFIACLLDALSHDNPLHLIITLRSDFLGYCTQQEYSGLGKYLQKEEFLILPPNIHELRDVIIQPLRLVGMWCEQKLEDELIYQTYNKGSLPLLQYVLEKLWKIARKERSIEITFLMYQNLGGGHGDGLHGVLNKKADDFFQLLSHQQQKLIEWLMLELSQFKNRQTYTSRRTVLVQELYKRQPKYVKELDQLLELLVTQERLLTKSNDRKKRVTVMLAHESLIHDWNRLQKWLINNYEIKIWRKRVKSDICDWEKTGGNLLREGRLQEAQRLLTNNPNTLLIGDIERKFIETSLKQHHVEIMDEINKKRRFIASLFMIIFVLFIGISATMWQWNKAEYRAKTTLAAKLGQQAMIATNTPTKTNGYLNQALLMSIQAFQFNKDSFTQISTLNNVLYSASPLQQTWYGHKKPVNSLSVSPNGKLIISGDDNGDLCLWNVKTGKLLSIWKGHKKQVNAVDFSPDGKYVISNSSDKTLKLWNVFTGKPIDVPWKWGRWPPGGRYIKFIPNTNYVIGTTRFGRLQSWNYKTGHPFNSFWSSSRISSFAISPDGKKIVVGGENTFEVLSIFPPHKRLIKKITRLKGAVTSLAFSQDGKYMVSGGGRNDHMIRLWDTKTWQMIGTSWKGHKYSVLSLAFSPDARYVVSGGGDKTIRLWDSFTGELIGRPWIGHEGVIYGITFSLDGNSIISGSDDSTLRKWKVPNRPIIVGENWYGHKKEVTSVVFSPDGNYVISGSADSTLLKWDLSTGKPVTPPWVGHTRYITSIAISSDGKYVVSASGDKTLRLWNAKTGQQIGNPWFGSEDRINSVSISQNNKYVVSGSGYFCELCSPSNNSTRLWNLKTGELIGKPWVGHFSPVTSVAFTPDSKFVISASGLSSYDAKVSIADNSLRLWNIDKGIFVGLPWDGHKSKINSIAISPNGKYVVSGSDDKSLRLWDIKKGKQIGQPWYGHKHAVKSVSFDSSGKYVGSISRDGDLILWSVETGKQINEPVRASNHVLEGNPLSMAFSPNRKYIIIGTDENYLRLWNIPVFSKKNKNAWKGHKLPIYKVVFSPNGKYVASAGEGGIIIIWNAKTGNIINRIINAHQGKAIGGLSFSPSSQQLISGGDDHVLRAWNVKTGLNIWKSRLRNHKKFITSTIYSPNGKYVASSSADNTILLWDAVTGKPLGKSLLPHNASVTSIDFSYDGKYLVSGTTSPDKSIYLWNVKTGKIIGKPWKGHTDSVTSVAFSPDGKYVISGSHDSSVRLWDVASQKLIGRPWQGHRNSVMSVAFSPDGKYIASASSDFTIRLWDKDTGLSIANRMKHEGTVWGIDFSPDGKYIISGGSDIILRVWSASPQDWAKKACHIVNRNFTKIEWKQFVGDIPYQITCPKLQQIN